VVGVGVSWLPLQAASSQQQPASSNCAVKRVLIFGVAIFAPCRQGVMQAGQT
jgi:hypothetical protein